MYAVELEIYVCEEDNYEETRVYRWNNLTMQEATYRMYAEMGSCYYDKANITMFDDACNCKLSANRRDGVWS